MPTLDIKGICAEITAAQRQFDNVSQSAFRKLKEFDTELHEKAIQTLENEKEAALWFSDPLEAFKGQTAWEMLLTGNRQVILAVLARMEYGVYG